MPLIASAPRINLPPHKGGERLSTPFVEQLAYGALPEQYRDRIGDVVSRVHETGEPVYHAIAVITNSPTCPCRRCCAFITTEQETA